MRKRNYIYLFGSAILGLTMSAMPVSADDAAATAPVSQASSVQVVTNPDPASQPGQATDWSDPAKYQGYVPVQILGINDFHGGLSNTGTAQIGDQTYQNTGTAERLAGSLNQAENDFKAANPDGTTIRVEAGDMVGASPANSALLQDESTMHALKAMHIEYGTLGNHEFDEGLGEFNRIVTGGQPTKQYNDAEMAYPHEASDINIITANVILKGTKTDDNYGEIPYGFQPYIIKEIHTSDNKVVKIGFIGIETTDLPILTLYDNYKDYEILDEAETIAHYEKILRNQGVNAIVVLAHTGVETKNGETKGTAVDIIQKLYQIDPDNSVDIYLAGHSHQYANATVGSVKLVQAIYTGKAYDDIIGYINPATNDFAPDSFVSHVFPVLSEKDNPAAVSDPTVAGIVEDATKRVAPVINQKIGEAATPETITGRLHNTPTRENQAGELVVDGQLAEARKLGVNADFAMTNTGGVRADLVVEPDRTITWGAAQAVQPFGNILRVVEMTGQQIIDALNQQYDEDQKYYLQIAGLKYYYTDSDDPNQPYRVVAAYDENGQPLDMNKTYRVVINDFLAGGGDGFTAFKGTNQIAVIGADTEVFMSYIADQTSAGNLIKAPVTDRKNYLTPAEAEALLHPIVPDTPANSETGQTNTENNSNTNGSAADAKQSQEITVDNSAALQLKIVNGQDQTAPVAIAVKSTEQKASQTALPQTGNDEKSALALLGTALIGLSGMFVIRRRPRRQK